MSLFQRCRENQSQYGCERFSHFLEEPRRYVIRACSFVGLQVAEQFLKRGSSVVSALASGARGPRFDSCSRRGRFRSPNTLSLVSFAGMTLDKCIVLRIGTLTGCPLCRESHPLCRLKNPTIILIWLLVGFHPATRSVQCTPAYNARKRAPGSI